jgi:hypothetical protein
MGAGEMRQVAILDAFCAEGTVSAHAFAQAPNNKKSQGITARDLSLELR